MSQEDWDKAEDLLRVWLRRAREGQHMHHEAGKYFRRAHYTIAIPVVVITTVLGTATFATITSKLSATTKIWFGALTLLAAALAALQLHLRYLERAEKHKSIGANYGKIRRDIETLLALTRTTRGDAKEAIATLKADLDRISSEGDAVSRRIYNKTLERLAARDRTKRDNPESLPQP
ncbi:SLATT domain-containing protein [Actinoplanes nipponensis]|uniref:SLATT domain-containing protein n=1 Tax=Actinoplanes nipponensis TaxID=135950 RepID=UPI00194171C8|nr:SLATT domain-containing protein [Actinoplanes nipponensis]